MDSAGFGHTIIVVANCRATEPARRWPVTYCHPSAGHNFFLKIMHLIVLIIKQAKRNQKNDNRKKRKFKNICVYNVSWFEGDASVTNLGSFTEDK